MTPKQQAKLDILSKPRKKNLKIVTTSNFCVLVLLKKHAKFSICGLAHNFHTMAIYFQAKEPHKRMNIFYFAYRSRQISKIFLQQTPNKKAFRKKNLTIFSSDNCIAKIF